MTGAGRGTSSGQRTGSATGPELQAVMFDMDGLLVDTEPLWFAAESEVMARLGGAWTRDDQAKLVGGSLGATVSYLLAKAGSTVAPKTVASWLVDAMVTLIRDRGPGMMPGAGDLLASLAAAGLPVALVTSSQRSVMDAVLAQLARVPGLPPFGVTVCGADVTHAKPHPEPYLLAARRLGAEPQRCVVLEDAPNGIAAAEAAGCVVVVVPGVAAVPPRDGRTVLRSLREVSVAALRVLVSQPGR